MKKSSFKIGILIFLLSFGFPAFAYDFVVDGIYYNINVAEKTVTVTNGKEKYVGDVKIPSSVVYSNQNLTVVSIGKRAFEYCNLLVSVEIPNSVTEFGEDAFVSCTSLVSIEIPNSVTEISSGLFRNCSSLVSVEIPNSVTKISSYAFEGCSSLGSVEIPNSVTEIGFDAFGKCSSLVSVEIPNSVTEISSYAFKGCSSLVSVSIPNSITEIKDSIFSGCSSLVSVDIPNSVTKIGYDAFNGCSSLVSVEIPNSVTEVEYNAFEGCSSLVSVAIPNTVTEISNCLFKNCSSLISVVIPNSVTEIGYSAFDGCINLKSIIFEDGESTLKLYYGSKYSYFTFKDSPLEEIYLGRNLSFGTNCSPFSDNNTTVFLSLGKFTDNATSVFPQNNEGLILINCYNPNPPQVNNFTNIQYANLIINIPKGSLEAYKSHPIWGLFWNLQETDTYPVPDIKAKEIILNINEIELYIRESVQLEATIFPENTTNPIVTWSSSNENIATVSEEGLVTAITVGEATITATCGEVSAKCVIIVLDDAGVEGLLANPDSKISVYSTDGVLIKKDCYPEDLKSLTKGIYIIVSGKERCKISI